MTKRLIFVHVQRKKLDIRFVAFLNRWSLAGRKQRIRAYLKARVTEIDKEYLAAKRTLTEIELDPNKQHLLPAAKGAFESTEKSCEAKRMELHMLNNCAGHAAELWERVKAYEKGLASGR